MIGQRIGELRLQAGYSQEGFAANAGLDRAYYGGVERGERNIAALNLITIAGALGAEVGDLFPPLRGLRKLCKRQSFPRHREAPPFSMGANH
ncbi:MAG: helix-turn-helix transcriptional regulator [Gammaproteobacteria bacterium]|nr:helix-turn-helix transcriptional regulator [Gammaproteobacteria bacterium]